MKKAKPHLTQAEADRIAKRAAKEMYKLLKRGKFDSVHSVDFSKILDQAIARARTREEKKKASNVETSALGNAARKHGTSRNHRRARAATPGTGK